MKTLMFAATLILLFIPLPSQASYVEGFVPPTNPIQKRPVQDRASRSAARHNWEAVAQCESSGDWHSTVGMFEGGLQFLPTTWEAYGGEGHAYDASRAQQIVVAERVLKDQGIGAWPVCGSRL